jgi:hypothetical protein
MDQGSLKLLQGRRIGIDLSWSAVGPDGLGDGDAGGLPDGPFVYCGR